MESYKLGATTCNQTLTLPTHRSTFHQVCPPVASQHRTAAVNDKRIEHHHVCSWFLFDINFSFSILMTPHIYQSTAGLDLPNLHAQSEASPRYAKWGHLAPGG
ncbi:hypothetical protein HYPSUDRAFT_37399 [Hypholoma sublateritium FD-334 SS-4]|uniref:Uncharacterized protein n=1 Tax=Hypholoma sublateritium (strain FD-334 SS-4) TaxID=945553 RepID=A0A0D2P9X2_HYPSF|nr:hypothetical protein HYPSUDRAFT_37399 [Hypholoma sublateritium FD-334 SS-4]